jgi:hypothetical protein
MAETNTPNTLNTPQNNQQIRERAYEIYRARGCEQGNEVSDWLEPERDVKESDVIASL